MEQVHELGEEYRRLEEILAGLWREWEELGEGLEEGGRGVGLCHKVSLPRLDLTVASYPTAATGGVSTALWSNRFF